MSPATLATAIGAGLVLLLVLHGLTMRASGAGLHVDEAQYWDWSRHLQWGYWSKPPGVAVLIAASTQLFGNGLLGVRLLGMACWPAAAAVLAALAWRIGGTAHGTAAALWTAGLFATTPAAGLLGLVVTTDGPLLLCWALAMLACWHAIHPSESGQGAMRWRAWWVLGLVLGLGLLSKYTAAAFVLGALPGLWRLRQAPGAQRWQMLGGPALALGVMAVLLLPHLLWNARHGWPTLTHTAAITAQASARPGAGPLTSLAEYLLGQGLLLGPAALMLAWRVRPRGRAVRHADQATALGEGFALAMAVPLLCLGALQALNAKAQMNWTAPALAGLCLWLGLRAARAGLGVRPLLWHAAGGLAITTAVALAATVLPAWAGRQADIWARMRGWDAALDGLRLALLAQPALPVAAAERDVLVQARRAWRDSGRQVLAWPADGAPQNHYQQFESLVPAGAGSTAWPDALLLLCETEPSAAQQAHYLHWRRLALGRADSGRQLSLWRAEGRRGGVTSP
ncbi:glycosyltransferase family 39 protein [Ideonella sp. DXS22W]|uniref:Glycosyltransferase family 39 protein n=1 Tax=Pseudaquabacterium inlustre TaxID=2984192 RepID=A0ABU9CD31_9BURK